MVPRLGKFTFKCCLTQYCSYGLHICGLLVLLLKHKQVTCPTFEEKPRQAYNDKLCLFRSLADHLHCGLKWWKEKFREVPIGSSLKAKFATLLSFKVFVETINQLLEFSATSFFSCIKLILCIEKKGDFVQQSDHENEKNIRL